MKIGKQLGGSSEWVIEEAGYVKEICFYYAGQVWYRHEAGYLEHKEDPTAYGTEKVAYVEIDEPTRRIKLEPAMEKCENFWMRKKSTWKHEKDGATLYIYMKPVSPDTVKVGESETREEFAKCFSIPLLAVTDGGKPLNVVKVIQRGSQFHVLNEFGKQCEAMGKAFSLDGIGIDSGDIRELLKKYNVQRKVDVRNTVRDEESGKELEEFTEDEILRLADDGAIHRWHAGSCTRFNIFNVSSRFKQQHGENWLTKLREVAALQPS